MITTKQLRKVTSMLDDIIKDYRKENPKVPRNWRTYEQQLFQRLQTAFDELRPLVFEATEELSIIYANPQGAKSSLTLQEKVLLLLLKHLFGKSNRNMACMTVLFSWLTGISVSYKTIERLYSDPAVVLSLSNLHILILDKRGVDHAHCAGDGTGYALTVKKHYASHAQILKDAAKVQKLSRAKKSKKKKPLKKKKFVYSFAIMDIDTRMYIGFGTSFKSESEAYKNALSMTKETDVKVTSVRLDRYYSNQAHVKELQDLFGDMEIYLIPKKDATIRGPKKWFDMAKRFITDTKKYLKQYYKRNQSESGFSEDKKRIGWKLGQKREDRIDTSNVLTCLWHNLMWLAKS